MVPLEKLLGKLPTRLLRFLRPGGSREFPQRLQESGH